MPWMQPSSPHQNTLMPPAAAEKPTVALPGAVLTGVCPLLLLLLAVMESDHETVLGINGLLFGALIMLAGFAVYLVSGELKILRAKPVVPEKFEDLETV